MKLSWRLFLVGICLLTITNLASSTESELVEEDDKEVLVRTVRGTRDRASGNIRNGGSGGSAPSCRYAKGQWTECDSKNNTRTRTLTLKKGDKTCEQTKVVTKKCKKACRYEKGTWGECVNQQMARVDTVKAKSDSTCEKSRKMTKRCKAETVPKKSTKGKQDRNNKKTAKQ